MPLPDSSPLPGKRRNEPAYVKYTAEKIAQIKGLTLEDVGRITTLNARLVFGLGGASIKPLVA